MGVRATLAVVGVLVAAACGGQSLDHGNDTGGSGGTAGGSGAGGSPLTGGASGSAGAGGSGHAAAGGTGGSGVGGSGVGGSGGAGATGAGRGGSGPAGTGGTVGTAGSGPVAGGAGMPSGVCTLPLEVGPCDAAITRYGFNPKTRRCEQFTYGGCDGNENNFQTFEECFAACGPGDESDCPAGQPGQGSACTGPDHPCDYSGTTGCLCQPTGAYACDPIITEPSCFSSSRVLPPGGTAGAAGECVGPDCPQAIVIVAYYTCSCDGKWSCLITGTGGPAGGR